MLQFAVVTYSPAVRPVICKHLETFRVQVTSKQNRIFVVLFWIVILFNRLNVNMFFSFVCLSDCKYLLLISGHLGP